MRAEAPGDVTQSRSLRLVLGAVYLLLLAVGPLAVIYPPQALREAVSSELAVVWGLYIALGAAICLGGVIVRHWFGEYVGLHLVWSAFVLYGLVALTTFEGRPDRAAGAVCLVAAGLLFLVRWLVVRAQAHGKPKTVIYGNGQE